MDILYDANGKFLDMAHRMKLCYSTYALSGIIPSPSNEFFLLFSLELLLNLAESDDQIQTKSTVPIQTKSTVPIPFFPTKCWTNSIELLTNAQQKTTSIAYFFPLSISSIESIVERHKKKLFKTFFPSSTKPFVSAKLTRSHNILYWNRLVAQPMINMSWRSVQYIRRLFRNNLKITDKIMKWVCKRNACVMRKLASSSMRVAEVCEIYNAGLSWMLSVLRIYSALWIDLAMKKRQK